MNLASSVSAVARRSIWCAICACVLFARQSLLAHPQFDFYFAGSPTHSAADGLRFGYELWGIDIGENVLRPDVGPAVAVSTIYVGNVAGEEWLPDWRQFWTGGGWWEAVWTQYTDRGYRSVAGLRRYSFAVSSAQFDVLPADTRWLRVHLNTHTVWDNPSSAAIDESPFYVNRNNSNDLKIWLPQMSVGALTRRTPGRDGVLTVPVTIDRGTQIWNSPLLYHVHVQWLMGDGRVLENATVDQQIANRGLGVETVKWYFDAALFRTPPPGARSIRVYAEPAARWCDGWEGDNVRDLELPDIEAISARFNDDGSATFTYRNTGGEFLHDGTPVAVAIWVNSDELLRTTKWRQPLSKQPGEWTLTLGKSLGNAPKGATGLLIKLDGLNVFAESNEENNQFELQMPRVSFEIRDAPQASTKEMRMVRWVQLHRQQIESAARKWMVTPKAIAGAIMWEGSQNVQSYTGLPLDNYGPGKVHYSLDSPGIQNPFGFYTNASKVEKVGWLPIRDWADRGNYLRKIGGSCDYIGGIMHAYAHEAARAGFSIRGSSPLLCNFFNGSAAGEIDEVIEDDYFGRKRAAGQTLVAYTGRMSGWVAKNQRLIRLALKDSKFKFTGLVPPTEPVGYPAPYIRPAPAAASPLALRMQALTGDVTEDDADDQQLPDVASTHAQPVLRSDAQGVNIAWTGGPDTVMECSSDLIHWVEVVGSRDQGAMSVVPQTDHLFFRLKVETPDETDILPPLSSDPDADGSTLEAVTGVQVEESLDVAVASPRYTLIWDACPKATSYDLMVLRSADRSIALSQSLSVGTLSADDEGVLRFVLPDSLPAGDYLVQVCAKAGTMIGAWSDEYAFQIAAIASPQVAWLLPPDGAVDVPASVTLRCSSIPSATLYEFQVEPLGGASIFPDGYALSGSASLKVSLERGRTYRARARARVLPQGNPYSEWVSFTVQEVPCTQVTFPQDGATAVPPDITLQCAPVAEASMYEFAVEKEDGTALVPNGYVLSTRPHVQLTLPYETTVRIRARARVVSQGNPYSEWIRIRTADIPRTELLSPADGATGVDAASVTLKIAAVDGANGYDFVVRRKADHSTVLPGGYQLVFVPQLTVQLDPSTDYEWEARARVIDQGNPYVGWFSFRTADPPPVPVPGDISAVRTSGGSLRVNWSYAGAPPDRFEIWQRRDGGSLVFGENVPATVRSAERTGLETNHTYSVVVRAILGGRASEFSPAVDVMVRVEPPTGITASAAEVGSIRVGWTYSSGMADSFAIWQKRDDQAAYEFGENVPPDHVSAVRTGLTPGHSYSFKVLAVQSGLSSPLSDASASAVVPSVPVPGSVSATTTSGSSFRVTWTYSGATPERFEIWHSSDGGALTFGENVPATTRSAERTGLPTNHTYTVYVRAIVGGHTGEWSTPDSVLVRVEPPSNVTATATTTSGAIKVTWKNNAGTVDRFEVWQRREDQASFVFGENVPATSTSATRDGLTASKRYYFRVLAVIGVKSPLSTSEATAIAPR